MCLCAIQFLIFLNLSFSSASEEEIGKQIHTVMLWLWPHHTHLFLFKYCLFVSTYLHPFSLTAGRATGCIWCCAFHASCGAHGAFAQGLWGEGHLLLSPYVPCSVIQCPNSLRILSIKALKEPVAQKTYENILLLK